MMPSSEKQEVEEQHSTIRVERPHLSRLMSTPDGWEVHLATWGGSLHMSENNLRAIREMVSDARRNEIPRVELRIMRRAS